MGMDVCGLNPTSTEGEYFARNVWAWDQLASLCETVAPEESRPCRYWHYNEGDGLDAEEAMRLADRLEEVVANGQLAALLEWLSKEDNVTVCSAISAESVSEFIGFLRTCGGFRIW